MQARMDIDYGMRVELLRMTVMRRATDLRSEGDRKRFAENMAFVYRMDEAVVRALLDDVLGVEDSAAPA
jgi:hypothetical protein